MRRTKSEWIPYTPPLVNDRWWILELWATMQSCDGSSVRREVEQARLQRHGVSALANIADCVMPRRRHDQRPDRRRGTGFPLGVGRIAVFSAQQARRPSINALGGICTHLRKGVVGPGVRAVACVLYAAIDAAQQSASRHRRSFTLPPSLSRREVLLNDPLAMRTMGISTDDGVRETGEVGLRLIIAYRIR